MLDNLTEDDMRMVEREIEMPQWMADLTDRLHIDVSAVVIDAMIEAVAEAKKAAKESET